jgi:DNA-binding NarL/FixJ family response regulator
MHDDILSRDTGAVATAPRRAEGPGEPVRVLLVAHADLVSESLRRALDREDTVHVVGLVDPHRGLATAIERGRPDVVLVTAPVCDTDGLEVIAHHHGAHPEVPVVLLADCENGRELGAAVAAGCAGFIAWDSGFPELVQAIRTVADGGVCMPRALAADLVAQMRPAPHSRIDLTDREVEILGLLARGMSTEEIVEHLVISVHTVRNHIRGLLGKLGAHSRLEAVAIATRQGLVPSPAGR